MAAAPLTETELIARIFAPLAGEGAFGLTDDAAIITPPPGCDLVVTVDALVAGVHFFPNDPPEAVARKALRVNLSDLAAKGARPLGFVLALALPHDWREDWLRAFAGGLEADAAQYGCPLLGGDTVAMPGPLTLSITVWGAVPAGGMVRRAGAKPGDLVAVTGTIGDAALGLQLRLNPKAGWATRLDEQAREHLRDRYLHPQPRNALAPALIGNASAAMDVSDGLVGDLGKLLAASGVAARVDLDAVPLSLAARAAILTDSALFDAAMTGGDDYELLLTFPEERRAALEAAATQAGVPLTLIGMITEGPGGPVFSRADRPYAFRQSAFDHFASTASDPAGS